MDYKKLLEQIKDYLSNCEQMRYGEMVGAPWPYNHDGPMVYTEPDAILLDQAATAITDLLARAEAAEARAEKAESERDAAVDQLRGDCEKCVNFRVTWNGCTPDFECPISDRCLNRDMWEWNGGEKEE